MIHVFAYGSNMCSPRLRQRVPTAVMIETGVIRGRRLAFHKRGWDGSGKADAVWTGRASDAVWGVLVRIDEGHRGVLDEIEAGYEPTELAVVTTTGTISAWTYLARPESIEAGLAPYDWYHRFVVAGAEEHRLPSRYVQTLRTVATGTDPDQQRFLRNVRLIDEGRRNAP